MIKNECELQLQAQFELKFCIWSKPMICKHCYNRAKVGGGSAPQHYKWGAAAPLLPYSYTRYIIVHVHVWSYSFSLQCKYKFSLSFLFILLLSQNPKQHNTCKIHRVHVHVHVNNNNNNNNTLHVHAHNNMFTNVQTN